MENATEFYGAFYGPDVTFNIENNTNLYGSIVAEDILLENQASFHYDRDLANYKKREPTGAMQMVAWKEI